MLTIIIKGTNGCNLNCSYCSLGEKKNFRYVNEENLKNILDFSCKIAIERNEKYINFIIHGGEPTLVNPYIYGNAFDFIKKQYSSIKIRISMQTNGYVFTEEYLRFIKKFDVHVGISIDGSKEIHDLERIAISGKATYDDVTRNIDKLIRNGIIPSCLMVLTKNAVGKGYDYLRFYEKYGLHLKVNPLLNYGEVYKHRELCLEQGDYATYIIGMYQYIIEKDINITISPIDNILQAILTDQRICECSFNKECHNHFLCIDYKGDIYPCGKFADMDVFKLGNINKADTNIGNSEILENLYRRRNKDKPLKCISCKYLNICNCGCSAEAMISGDFKEFPVLCEDYKLLFDYFYKEGLILLKKELLRQKALMEAK